jgi:hypothetical protein
MNTIKPATPLPWQPLMVQEYISRYHVVLCSPNGKEFKEVMVLAPNMESAEEHAQAQHPTMHVIDSWCAA